MQSLRSASLAAFSATFWLNCPWVPFPSYAVNILLPSARHEGLACKGEEQSR